MQAPGAPDEDTRGGFAYGGWATHYNDPVMMEEMGKGMAEDAAILLGRRTYEHFFKVWAGRTDNPFSPVLDNAEKYVASRSVEAPLEWKNSTLLMGEAERTVAALKKKEGKDLVVLGSGRLLDTLMHHELVDRFVLLIHPLVLTEGRRLFGNDKHPFAVRLQKTVTTSKGVIIATYDLFRPPAKHPPPSRRRRDAKGAAATARICRKFGSNDRPASINRLAMIRSPGLEK
jgi:dihydrofolate reductase